MKSLVVKKHPGLTTLAEARAAYANHYGLPALHSRRIVESSAVPKRLLFSFIVLLAIAKVSIARDFSVATYNVENLFDVDGVAVYEDYQSSKYTPAHLAVKVSNIAKALAQVDGGRGPDVIVFNEIELDQTPESTVTDYAAWIASIEDRKLTDILSENPLPERWAGVPSEAWLLKALHDAGLRGYHVVITDEKPGAYGDGRGIAIRNVIFSRFPVTAHRSHRTPDARAILEVTLDVDGHPLTVFGNHWKSGAGDLVAEETRRGNAQTLRFRLDEVLANDPQADVILAGDFNSHYNQNRRYRDMRRTALNDVLGSQGNELALRQKDGADLYNLWFELPSDQRGSDIYRNEWGTLMHLILARGLYDQHGIQYVDNSFTVMKIPGLNTDVFGRPIRWSRTANPAGFSDHFPILARFRTVATNDRSRWIALNRPGQADTASGDPRPVEISTVDLFAAALSFKDLPPDANLRDGTYDGRVFLVDAPATVDERGHVHVTVRGEEYDVFAHNPDLRAVIRQEAEKKSQLSFYGELGTYRGNWQFLLHGKEWFPAPRPR